MDEPLRLGEASFGGVTLPQYELTTDYLCPRSIVVFGGSNSGKTTFTNYLLHIMNENQIMKGAILFNPTGNTDYTKLFPGPFIHSKIEKGTIEELMKRQKMSSDLYRACNEPETIKQVYYKYCSGGEMGKNIAALKLEVATVIRSLRDREEDPTRAGHLIKNVEQTSEKVSLQLMKQALLNYWMYNSEAVRTPEDRLLMSNLNQNPHFLIIFDDAASALKPLWRSEVFEELYFNARHFFVTSIMVLQAATSMERKLRDNVHIVFFTCRKSMLSFFANGGSKEEKKIAESIAGSTFFDRKGDVYRVLFYSRGHFGFVISKWVKCGAFGSEIYQKYGQTLQEHQGTVLQRLAKEAYAV